MAAGLHVRLHEAFERPLHEGRLAAVQERERRPPRAAALQGRGGREGWGARAGGGARTEVVKIKLDKITVTQVEVEMPDVCPGCGETWWSETVEEQFVRAAATKEVVSKELCEVGIDFQDGGYGNVDVDEVAYIVGYTCAYCFCSIVSTEMPIEPNQNQEKLQGV